MTTNRDRAAEVIWDAQASGLAKPSDLADALEEEGLLADDLPAPDEGEWEVGLNVISLDGMHILPMIDNDALTPDKARAIALALLAAAAHAQKEENDE